MIGPEVGPKWPSRKCCRIGNDKSAWRPPKFRLVRVPGAIRTEHMYDMTTTRQLVCLRRPNAPEFSGSVSPKSLEHQSRGALIRSANNSISPRISAIPLLLGSKTHKGESTDQPLNSSTSRLHRLHTPHSLV